MRCHRGGAADRAARVRCYRAPMADEPQPVIVREPERAWETWPPEQRARRGAAQWKTLLSADRTPTCRLTMGWLELQPGERVPPHRHPQAEQYFVVEGEARLQTRAGSRALTAGCAVFVPGGALHGLANAGPGRMRMVYVLDAESFADVRYTFGDQG